MLSATTTRMPACSSAYGLASRLLPLPRRLPATEHTKPPSRTALRRTGYSVSPVARFVVRRPR